MKLPILFDSETILKFMKLSPATLTRLKRRGMPYIKYGHKTYMYPAEETLLWLHNRGYNVKRLKRRYDTLKKGPLSL